MAAACYRSGDRWSGWSWSPRIQLRDVPIDGAGEDLPPLLEVDAKDFCVLDMDAPVHLEGKIRASEIPIGEGVPIPLIEPGDAEDVSGDPPLRGEL
jgi:hypothetical protein